MDTHSRTECPFMSSRFSMLSMSYKEINENKNGSTLSLTDSFETASPVAFMVSHRCGSEARLF